MAGVGFITVAFEAAASSSGGRLASQIQFSPAGTDGAPATT